MTETEATENLYNALSKMLDKIIDLSKTVGKLEGCEQGFSLCNPDEATEKECASMIAGLSAERKKYGLDDISGVNIKDMSPRERKEFMLEAMKQITGYIDGKLQEGVTSFLKDLKGTLI